MKRNRTVKLLSIAGTVALTVLSSSWSAMAQCALCKNAVTGSPSAAKLSESLNFAIIILLIPPVLIFCGIFAVAYKYRKSSEADVTPPRGSNPELRAARRYHSE